ncbi:hypothetical protein Acr_00g0044880 [Actinidia rufa]|uniref:Uncharacterized protein n=1 Tax=Actinidia rufa TaxID=165716 RepID=A0A7J0DJF9_9ERIC|nr:hypothetical protein Acr_00g0044880 [Actinidia rufa]
MYTTELQKPCAHYIEEDEEEGGVDERADCSFEIAIEVGGLCGVILKDYLGVLGFKYMVWSEGTVCNRGEIEDEGVKVERESANQMVGDISHPVQRQANGAIEGPAHVEAQASSDIEGPTTQARNSELESDE